MPLGWLDNLIMAVSPRWGCERAAWRQYHEYLKSYDAAGGDRLNSGWRVVNESAELTDRPGRDVVRARARDLERNSDIALSVLSAYKRNVVGRGYTLRALTGGDGLDGQLEKAWKRWTDARNCDVTGEQSFNEILRMMVERKKVDGGILILFRYTRGGLVPFKLQCLEVDELDVSQSAPRHRGNKVVGGIEYDTYRRPVGCWFRQYDLEGYQAMEPVFVDAKDVFFYKSKRRPSQLREMSDLASTVTRIRDVNEFITAVAVKERLSAILAILIKRALPSGGTPGRGFVQGPDGKVDYAGKTVYPGMIMEMGAGDEAQIIDPKNTATDAAGFLKTQQGLIASGQGLSYEAVSRDMTQATYSSARQNAIEDEATYAEEIELLTTFMSEVYEAFVISGVLSGLFQIPDFWERKDDYLNHAWVKAPKKWIEPVKEATANQIALQTGQKTFPELCAEYGKDWKEAIDEMAEVVQYGREKGIDIGGMIFGTGPKKEFAASGSGGKPDDGSGDSGTAAGGGGAGKQPEADS